MAFENLEGTTKDTFQVGGGGVILHNNGGTVYEFFQADGVTPAKAAIASLPTGNTANTVCIGNDSRLSDARTPTSHAHGNIANGGTVGSTANIPLITGTAGIVQAGSFGTAAYSFCQGNDSRLSDDRTASGIRTATTIVSVSAAAAPITGQVLAATSSSTATWQDHAALFVPETYDVYSTPVARTANTLTSYRSITIGALAASATYSIYWDIAFSIPTGGTSGSGEIEIAVLVDGLNIWNFQENNARSGTRTKGRVSGMYQLTTTTATTHTIDVQWRSVNNATSMTIAERRVSYRRTS